MEDQIKRSRRIPALLSICLLLLFAAPLAAQPGTDWFTGNDRGNRYEGSYSRKVSNPSIELVSLTAYLASYTFGSGQLLQIRFFVPDPEEYMLKAEELQVTQFYWMQDKNEEAATGWNAFRDWPVDYLLKRFLIDSRNLGVLVRLGPEGSRKYSPALVYTGEQAPAPQRYIAMLRLGRSSADGSVRIYQGMSKEQLIKERRLPAKASGTAFPVLIPATDLGTAPGWVTLEINLREKGTLEPFTYSFSFYHQPK